MGQQVAYIERACHVKAHTFKVFHHDAVGQHLVEKTKSVMGVM